VTGFAVNGIPIARIMGIEIRVHVSWVVILAIITLGVSGQLSATHPGWPDDMRWVVSGLVAILFFFSVLAHELAHGIVARRRGIEGGTVTLLFFGGTTALSQEARRPGDEAAIASAGPIASLVIAFVCVGIWEVARGVGGTAADAIAAAALVLAALNLLLALLNLLPVFPLDGGRLVRAVAWRVTGDEMRASRVLALLSRYSGYAMVAGGLALTVVGDTLDGVMLALSGWFLASASRTLERRATFEALLKGVRVESVMERDLPEVSPQLTLDTFAAQYIDGGQQTSLPVIRDNLLLGLIGVAQLRRIKRKAWPTTRASDVMVSGAALPTLSPDDELWGALDSLRRTGLDGLPVMRGTKLLGILTRRAIVTAIQARGQPVAGATR
jgi:Zn-dependent protease